LDFKYLDIESWGGCQSGDVFQDNESGFHFANDSEGIAPEISGIVFAFLEAGI
jgi:hypothetical protein